MVAREMKDSGVDWLREIPLTWSLQKISTFYSLRTQKVSDKDYPPLSVTKKGVLPQLENVAKTDDGDNRKLVKKGDFVINSRSDRRGSCGISPLDGSVSVINTVLIPRGQANPQYFDWLFHTENFADEFYKWGSGIVDDLWSTRWQDMKRITIPVPDLAEQHLIAEFLNEKCSEVDSLTADIEKQIKTLQEYKKSVITEAVTKGLDPNVEMKDSGVEWIGIMPKVWSLKPLKHCVNLKTTKSKTKDGYVGLEHIKSWEGRLSSLPNEEAIPEGDTLVFTKGDVLFGKLRPYLAKCFFALHDGSCSTEFLVLKPITINGRFLKFSLLTSSFIDTVNMSTNGVKMPRANWDFIGTIKMPIPDIKEQLVIANFLDTKCAEIDSIVEEKQKQLEIFAQYKQSLIYEYVTGKKAVPM